VADQVKIIPYLETQYKVLKYQIKGPKSIQREKTQATFNGTIIRLIDFSTVTIKSRRQRNNSIEIPGEKST
jgi:hypothetical protein